MNYYFLNTNWLINRERFRKMLAEKYNEFIQVDCFGQTEFVVLTMTVLCKFVSVEEFVTYFRMKPSQVNNIFKNLKDKGLVETKKIVNKSFSRISRTDTLYTYTKKGYDTVKENEVGKHIWNEYRFVSENPKNSHDYVNGMNLFGAITAIEPYSLNRMEWIRENTYGDVRRAEGTLSIDGHLMLPDNRELLFETDMDNESPEVLLGKLDKYCKYPENRCSFLNKKNEKSFIVFSCFFPVRMDGNAFIQKNINPIVKQMTGFPDDMKAGEFYEIRGKYLEVDLASTLEEIINTPFGLFEGGTTMRDYLVLGDIREMATHYAIQNPFYLDSFNRLQYKKFREKKIRLTNAFTKATEYTSARCAADNGSPIYIVPTVLLGNYIGYISDFSLYRNKIASCLEEYFGQIDFSDYQDRVTFAGKNGGRFSLRNLFSSECGKICIEYLSIDIGALSRIADFYKEEKDMQESVRLIVIVDEYKDAKNCSMYIRDHLRHNQFHRGLDGKYYIRDEKKSCILYLKKQALERGSRQTLFFYSGYDQYLDANNKAIFKDNTYHRLYPSKYFREDIPF